MHWIAVAATGTQVTTGAASASAAIPNAADGGKARRVLLCSPGNCYVRAGASGVTATVNDLLIAANHPIVLNVRGYTHIAYLQETATAKLNITPLEE